MVDATIETELSDCLNQMPVEKQRQVLEFARTLVTKAADQPIRGGHGRELLRFAGTIDASNLDVMTQAIEAGCEKADVDEW